MKFALLTYRNTDNLGDEIQSIAARRFLPHVDALIDRDFLTEAIAPSEGPFGLVLNGWFMHRPEHWPPPAWIVPFPVSMHLADPSIRVGKLKTSVGEILLDDRLVSYLRRWGPVGARDLCTLEQLQAVGVPSYFSACLSLTLRRDPGAVRGDDIVLVDVPDEVTQTVRAVTGRDVVVVTHGRLAPVEPEARARRTEQLLERYQRAHCVITSRLHAALPSLAYETPVLLLRPDIDDGRLSGLEHLVRSCSAGEFVAGHARFDLDDPPPNDLDYVRFRVQLEEAVTGFVEACESDTYRERANGLSGVGSREREGTLWGLLADANRDLDTLRTETHGLRVEADALSAALQAREADIAAFRGSRSWRVTRPLRWVGTAGRRLRLRHRRAVASSGEPK